jgi:hypothetical protein
MIAAAMAALAGLKVASAIGQYKQAKADAKSVIKAGNIEAERRTQEIRELAAMQRVSYIAAGLELEGTPQAVILDTYNTGIADIKAIKSSYEAKAKRIVKTAQASLLGNLADAGMSLYSMSSGNGGTENMAGQSGGWNPSTSAPARKPTNTTRNIWG